MLQGVTRNMNTGGKNWRLDRALVEIAPVFVIFIISLCVDFYAEPFHRAVSEYDNGPSISFPDE
jgi:hypothetical protein